MKPPKILDLSLDLIDPPDVDLRDQQDPARLRDLADSLARRGLIQPIRVRATNGHYKIVAGNRRYLAARSLGWLTIPAIPLAGNGATDLATSLHENLFREDLTVMEQAALIAHLHDSEQMDLPAVARALNHTIEWVESRAALLAYPPPVQSALHSGEITLAAARHLAPINDPDYLATALEAAHAQGMTERSALEWARQYDLYKHAKAAGTPAAPPTAELVAAEAAKTICDLHAGMVYINTTKILRVCFDCLQALKHAQSSSL